MTAGGGSKLGQIYKPPLPPPVSSSRASFLSDKYGLYVYDAKQSVASFAADSLNAFGSGRNPIPFCNKIRRDRPIEFDEVIYHE